MLSKPGFDCKLRMRFVVGVQYRCGPHIYFQDPCQNNYTYNTYTLTMCVFNSNQPCWTEICAALSGMVQTKKCFASCVVDQQLRAVFNSHGRGTPLK